ncbi:hypothetical protein CLORY_44670 [Clostridium oryzae]|uniref:SGNH domain-containing protein n=1 Tax=Clostridium oryzae TaxID=1450648 RepID=A0A1V4I5F7_9CLOT|nr:hypothetical protein CLORY_44670 [Clostridium oryzae]
MKDFHNIVSTEEYNSFKEVNDKVFITEYNHVYVDSFKDTEWDNKNKTEELAKFIALEESNKNYPKTVLENEKVLSNYLDLLKRNNIKPILVVCPVSKMYSKYFSKELMQRFYNSINKLKKIYSFHVYDFFTSNLFCDNDFYDFTHLNEVGSEKLTNILNDIIS